MLQETWAMRSDGEIRARVNTGSIYCSSLSLDLYRQSMLACIYISVPVSCFCFPSRIQGVVILPNKYVQRSGCVSPSFARFVPYSNRHKIPRPVDRVSKADLSPHSNVYYRTVCLRKGLEEIFPMQPLLALAPSLVCIKRASNIGLEGVVSCIVCGMYFHVVPKSSRTKLMLSSTLVSHLSCPLGTHRTGPLHRQLLPPLVSGSST